MVPIVVSKDGACIVAYADTGSIGPLQEGQVWTFAGANGRTQEIEIVSLDSDAGTVVYAQSELIPDHLLALLPAGVTRHQIGTDTDAIAGLSRYLASVHAHLLADQSPANERTEHPDPIVDPPRPERTIYKTKWYLAERTGDRGYSVLEDGPFSTESKAFGSMYQRAAIQDPTRPSQILQERKPEWRDRHITTVQGRRILEHPHIYRVE